MRSIDTGRSGRRGFTVVELLIVITIASIMMGVAVPRMQQAFQQREVTGVRDGVVLLGAQARARAMERARTVRFDLDLRTGVAAIIEAGDTIDALHFADEFGVAAESDVSFIRLCYGPRGFATQPCSTALGGIRDVEFSRSGKTAAVEVWQLGQLRKL